MVDDRDVLVDSDHRRDRGHSRASRRLALAILVMFPWTLVVAAFVAAAGLT